MSDWADKLALDIEDRVLETIGTRAPSRLAVAGLLRERCIPRERVTRQIKMMGLFARFTHAENQHARATAIHALQATLEDDTDCEDEDE